ncbi:Inositol-1,4,5-trisphosphate 5-phosphatase 1, partial [Cryomyces antarcticus]
MVEFLKLDPADLDDYQSLSSLPVLGTLGLITINNDVFLCVVNGAVKIATVRPGETVQRIYSVEFYCLSRSEYDHLLIDRINPYPTDDLSEDGFEHDHGREPLLEHPCLVLKKLLSGGSFYYSTDFDLTTRLQDRTTESSTVDLDSFDQGFLWNSYMIQPLVSFRSRLSEREKSALDASGILTSAIRGFVNSIFIPQSSSPERTNGAGLPSSLTLISRLSCRRAGTRFNARGIDDDGNVANFVETETTYFSPAGLCFSYVQTRGSVPVFWEQATGLLPSQQKIQLTRSPEATQPAFDKHFEELEALSRIYAGTGALKSSFTRHGKMSLGGAIADIRKSATRVWINNFEDTGRQNTIDMLLGRLMDQIPVHLFDPINDYVTSELNKRAAEYSSSKSIHIWAGTFNLNGKTNGMREDLSLWLCPEVDPSQEQPEIVAVGFQEIVELSPQQIMSTDPERRQQWEAAVKKVLNANARRLGSEEYVLLRGGQLVGASLSIFVKANILPHIKNVEGSLKKTGMSGMAGNKGAVAVRMDYANTSLCFVTAHLAAGFSNYQERNRDYKTINHGLRFQRNRSIENHDTVIWLGDFNYRIGLNNERVRKLIDMEDLDTLYENDQLNLQMVAGLTFPYYSEARITFLPTYKYNNGTDVYDTS